MTQHKIQDSSSPSHPSLPQENAFQSLPAPWDGSTVRTIHVESANPSSILPPLDVRPLPGITPITQLKPLKDIKGKAVDVPTVSRGVTFGKFPDSPPSSPSPAPMIRSSSTLFTELESPSSDLSEIDNKEDNLQRQDAFNNNDSPRPPEPSEKKNTDENSMESWRQVRFYKLIILEHYLIPCLI